MGIFDNLKEVQTFEDGEKAPDGDYVIRIKKCIEKISGQTMAPMFIVEYEIVECLATPGLVGRQFGWVQHFKDLKVAKPAVKQFVMAAMGADKARDPAHYVACENQCEAAGQASTSQGLFNGKTVRLNVKSIKTRAGQPFKKHAFSAHV
jgi:hypothetical protein